MFFVSTKNKTWGPLKKCKKYFHCAWKTKSLMMKNLFCCMRHTCRRIPHFLTRRMENSQLSTKTRPNVRPIFAWRREISPYLLKRYESLLFSNVPMEQFAMELKVYA